MIVESWCQFFQLKSENSSLEKKLASDFLNIVVSQIEESPTTQTVVYLQTHFVFILVYSFCPTMSLMARSVIMEASSYRKDPES